MERALPLLVAILLVRLAAREAQYQRAKRVGEIFRFPPGIGVRMILGLGSPFLVYVTYRVWLESRQTGEWWLPVLSGLLVLGTLLFRPPDIEVRPDGVYELSFLGLRKKRILWQGAAASFVPGLHEVLLIGSDGTTLKHTSYHVGQDELLFQLRKHHVFVQ